jgi:hypothetical protein
MKAQDKQGMLRSESQKHFFSVVRIFLGMLVFCCISPVDAVPTSSNTGESEQSSLERDLSQARGFNGKRNQERLRENERAAKQRYPVNEGEVGIAGFIKWAKNLWKTAWHGVRYGSWYWKILPLALIWMVYSVTKS